MGHSRTCSLDVLASKSDRRTDVYSRGIAQLVGWQNGAHDECSESRQRKVEMNN